MNIGFYCQSEGPHWDIGVELVKSAKRVMPSVPVYHLTNMDCPAIEGAEPIRIPKTEPMGVHRIRHYSQLSGDWVLCDSDVIFLKDVSGVFDDPFDVALATRKGSFLEDSEFERVFPYNFGVVFSRSREFWVEALDRLKSLPESKQEWEGEQFVTGRLANSGKYALKVLPREFNYTPEVINEELKGVSVLHLKWKRKRWLPYLKIEGQCALA